MSSSAALLLALTPFTHEATPLALGLGHEQLIQTEGACGTFCLSASNAQFDVKGSAHASMALVPQQKGQSQEGLLLSPNKITTYDFSWHPVYNVAASAGYRTSTRSTEREIAAKSARRISASTQDIPVGLSGKTGENFSIGAKYILRNVELKQEALTTPSARTDTLQAQPNRWSVDAVWQKDDQTGLGISYISPTSSALKRKSGSANFISTSAELPQWTDPQEFTASIAKLSAIKPPDGVVFGPFENVFHASLSVVTWETGKPVSYSALASASTTKDGWNLTDNGTQTSEFRFDTLDPSLSVSAGLESLWARNAFGSLSTYTHIRMNHIASRKELNQWQGGFGVGVNSRYVSLQATSLWREKESGYALGLSSSL